MSYLDLADKFEVVVKHVKKGCATISSLTNFFKNYKKFIEAFNASLQKIIENISIDIQDDSSTLEIALNGLYNCFKKSISDQTGYCKSIQLEIIEPLELFLEHHNEAISENITSGESSSKSVNKAKESMIKSRHKYYKHSASAEKNTGEEKSSKQNKNLLNKSREEYLKTIENVNKYSEDFDSIIPEVMSTLQQNEENRIHFVKLTLDKFIKQALKNQVIQKENIENVAGLVNNVNSDIDIQVFVDTHQGRYKSGIREEFVSYQKWREKRKEINDAEIKENEENFEEILEKAIKFILSGEDTDSDSSLNEIEAEEPDFTKISEALKLPSYRSYFIDLLESKRNKFVLTPTKMNLLVSYLKSLLTSIMIDDDKDPHVFTKILSLIQYFYTDSQPRRRVYLSTLISGHSIWTEKHRWLESIETSIAQKVFSDKESLKKYAKQFSKKKSGLFGALKNIAHKIPSVFSKETIGDESEKTAAFIVITQFSSYMSQLSMPLEVCNSIILLCCQRAGLDSNRTCTLLAELEAHQRSSIAILSPLLHSLRTREKERKNFGKTLQIGMAIEFLDPKSSVQLIFVCKQWKNDLQVAVLKKCLLWWDLPKANLTQLRSLTWTCLLKGYIREIDYKAFVNRVKSNPDPEIDEVISLDVARSYQGSALVPSESLKNILLVYAFYNPEVGYCQGMNYIAGTIFSQFQDEEKSLKFMVALIEKFKMTELFITDLPKLKQFFYQLDRIIGMELPELHELFKNINIGSGHFCAPWFITLFASHLQNKPLILGKLWDLFLLDGWKTIFKAAVVILRRLSNELISTNFEDIMFALGGLQGNSPIVDVFDTEFIKSVYEVNITNSLLKEIEAEYLHLRKRAEKHTKSN